MPNPDDPLHTFRAWSLVHCSVIAAAVVIGLALAALRRRWRDKPAAQRLDRTLAALTAAAWLITQLLSFSLADSPVATALPLHVSDLTTLAIPIALWTCARPLRAIVYYWGLTLGSLAFVLPDLGEGPAQLGFWVFWLPHVIILGAVLYELVGRDYRPRWRDLGFAALASLAYAMLIIPFNAATGFGYGYLGPDHANQPPAVAYFGTWPLRCLFIILTGVAGMALLTLPWRFSTRRRAAGLSTIQEWPL
jgi:hypothetical integral membrane protein (TIGR02206 family)